MDEISEHKLPDVLRPNLKLVFCGSAAGEVSARLRNYYAGPGNKFWKMLYKIRLTPVQLRPMDYAKLLNYDIGLTDLAKLTSGQDSRIKKSDYDINSLKEKMRIFKPDILCFNGKRAANIFMGSDIDYGLQSRKINSTILFVAPSTSGAANRYWDENFWQELARLYNSAT